MRCVFSVGLKDRALGKMSPPGGVGAWRAMTRLLSARSSAGIAAGVVRTIADDVITTFFPADCRVCGEPLTRAGAAPVCETCVGKISEQTWTLCRCCGEALDVEGVWFAGQFPSEGLMCRPCRMVPTGFERAVAFGTFEGELRELIHLLKYERLRPVADVLGEHLAGSMLELREQMPDGCVVVAVPLFPAKQRQRGYNQAQLLASSAVRRLKRSQPGWKLSEEHGALARVKDTQSQYMLTPTGRRRNLDGAFQVVKPAAITGRDVLLIDDIYTSGATARACTTALKRAAARRVYVATLSRAQREMVANWKTDSSVEVEAWR